MDGGCVYLGKRGLFPDSLRGLYDPLRFAPVAPEDTTQLYDGDPLGRRSNKCKEKFRAGITS